VEAVDEQVQGEGPPLVVVGFDGPVYREAISLLLKALGGEHGAVHCMMSN
jgi:hypothetical protein